MECANKKMGKGINKTMEAKKFRLWASHDKFYDIFTLSIERG